LQDPGAIRPHLQGYAAMGILDDAIREHLELKRRLGTSEEELERKETEAFGPAGARPAPAPAVETGPADESAEEPEFQVQRTAPVEDVPAEDGDPWAPEDSDQDLLEPDEVLPRESLESNGSYAPPPPVEREREAYDREAEEPHEDPLDEWEEEPAEEPPQTEDVLQETPEFLEETPEHDRLWFEQKPPKDFDLD
jgi:hypothetical protein